MYQVIRNPEAFNKAQAKKAAKRQRLINSARRNLPGIIDTQYEGTLKARNKIEALDMLIRNGVFGASSKIPLRVSRDRKYAHISNSSQQLLKEAPIEYKRWYELAEEALERALQESAVSIEYYSNGSVHIATGHVSQVDDSVARDLACFAQVYAFLPEIAASNDPPPLTERLTAKQLGSLEAYEIAAY